MRPYSSGVRALVLINQGHEFISRWGLLSSNYLVFVAKTSMSIPSFLFTSPLPLPLNDHKFVFYFCDSFLFCATV